MFLYKVPHITNIFLYKCLIISHSRSNSILKRILIPALHVASDVRQNLSGTCPGTNYLSAKERKAREREGKETGEREGPERERRLGKVRGRKRGPFM